MENVKLHIEFDSKSKREVMAVKAALDLLAKAFDKPAEVPVEPVKEPVRIEVPAGSTSRPFVKRHRPTVLFEDRLNDAERKKYPGLYKLAVLTLESMDKSKLYAIDDLRDYVKSINHPASSASGVLTRLVQKGYVERPMRGMYKRLK